MRATEEVRQPRDTGDILVQKYKYRRFSLVPSTNTDAFCSPQAQSRAAAAAMQASAIDTGEMRVNTGYTSTKIQNSRICTFVAVMQAGAIRLLQARAHECKLCQYLFFCTSKCPLSGTKVQILTHFCSPQCWQRSCKHARRKALLILTELKHAKTLTKHLTTCRQNSCKHARTKATRT